MSSDSKLGFWGLTALVFGLMVGVGIFNLPQNMAAVASPCAVAVAWLITGAGILPLVMVFRWLSNNYPQYNAGLYQYAQAGFGNLAGIGFFIRARRTYFPQQHRIFTVREQYFLALLIIASVISVTVLLNFYN